MPGTQKVLSNDPYIDGLLWDGWMVDASPLVYGFPDTAAQYPTASAGFDTLNTLQRDAARLAFHEVDAFTNYSFFDGGIDGVIRLAGATMVDTNNNTDTLEQTITTASGRAPTQANEDAAMDGDIWFHPTNYDTPLVGSYAFASGIIHEIGHALGLKHPHDIQGSAQLLPADRDGLAYSIMSYRDFPGDGIDSINSGNNCPQSYMMYDIQALQYLYGAEFTLNATDNTVYKFTPTIEAGKGTNFFVNGNEYEPNVDLAANIVFRTIWDSGGNDTYDFSLYTTNLSVNLAPGEWTSLGTQLAVLSGDPPGFPTQNAPGNIANAFLYQGDTRSLIENAIGGSGHDTLLGNQIGNQLTGNAGNDFLKGFGGHDTLIGGADNDTYFLSDTTASGYDAVVEEAGGGDADEIVITGGSATSYSLGANIENGTVSILDAFDLAGNNLNNRLTGNDAANILVDNVAGQDTLLGRGGDDSLAGGLDDDYLDGGDNSDTASFAGNKADFAIVGSATDLTIADRTPGRYGIDRVLNVETFIFLDGTFAAADLANAAPIITSNGGNNLAVLAAENTYFVTKVGAIDPDADPLTFALSGADAALFQLAANGDITFRTAPDFEAPVGGDNVYDLVVTVTDTSFATDTQAITVTVTDVVEITDTDSGTLLNGTAGADTIIPGDGQDNVLAGDGNDVIKATINDGRDNYQGGNGNDTVDYSALTSAVDVRLGPLFGKGQAVGKTTGSQSGDDTLTSVENAIGSAAGDQISGSFVDNVLQGGAGNDLLTGGAGNDTFEFRPGFGLDQVTDFDDAGNDTILFSTAVFADWTAVQNAMSASGADVVITLDAANSITLLGTTLASMTQTDFLFTA
jgi:serralysin